MKPIAVTGLIILFLFGIKPGQAQDDDIIFKDAFHFSQMQWHPFEFQANQNFDVGFQCEMTSLVTGTVSPFSYFLTFDGSGQVNFVIFTDAHNPYQLAGSYIYRNDVIEYQADSMGFTMEFSARKIFPRLGMLGYFEADGQANSEASRMRCLAYAHGYNPQPESFQRFSCPSQVTAAGSYENAFEWAMLTASNTVLSGSLFRQRDFYAHGNISGEPDLIERSDFGLYRLVGDTAYLDFNYGPDLNNPFSDWNQSLATLSNSGQVLNIPDGLPPIGACQ